MKRIQIVITLASLLFLIVGCAGTIKDPQSDQYTLYAKGISEGQMDIANSEEDAWILAQQRMGGFIDTHVKGLTKRAREQIGLGKDAELNSMFSQATKAVVDQQLRFMTVYGNYKTTGSSKKGYKTVVWGKLNCGPINDEMMENLKKRQRLYERFRTSQLFTELEDEIAKGGTPKPE